MKPYLISDPQGKGVLNYSLLFDGTISWNQPVYEIQEGPDTGKGMLKFHLSLSGLDQGPHQVDIKAINGYGEGPPVSFNFDSTLPDAPMGIRIEMLP